MVNTAKQIKFKDLKNEILIKGIKFKYGGGSAWAFGEHVIGNKIADIRYFAPNFEEARKELVYSSFKVYLKIYGDKVIITEIKTKY